MVTEEKSSEPTPQVERWVFGGSRVMNGKRAHCWVDPAGQELHYRAAGSGYAIGGVYETRVVRHDDGVSKYGNATFTGDRCEDGALVDQLSARHRAAEVALDPAARERRYKQADPLEQAIERLCELAAKVPASQRSGFAVYATNRLMRAWK